MHGISIRYSYDGPEEPWEAAINAFIDAVNSDPELSGKFHYEVNIAKAGAYRVHWGRWDEQQTVDLLQSRPYFKEFAAALKNLAGDSLSPVPIRQFRRTD